MKYKFDKICNCLQLMGYDDMIQWWKLRCELMGKQNRSRFDGEPNMEYFYEQAVEIVIQDGKRTMKDCEKHSIEKVLHE